MGKEVEPCSVDAAADEISQQSERRKGGLITMPFIIANEAFSSMASVGISPNMIVYLMGSHRLHLGNATQILLLSSAANNFTPVIGAFLVDSYLGRFLETMHSRSSRRTKSPCKSNSVVVNRDHDVP
ncbi:unnamed protein product [Lathyrus sativus]|nr:unnamed protein product [Lathyrus sativus]